MSPSSIARSLSSTNFTKSLNNFSTASVFGVGFSTAVLLIVCLHSVSKIQSEDPSSVDCVSGASIVVSSLAIILQDSLPLN